MVSRNIAITWLVSIASFSLLAAVAVYLFARIYPPEVLAPFQVVNTNFVTHSAIFGSAPSFFYTLALGLVIGVCASNSSSARFHCLMWIGLCLLLEISQHSVPSAWITIWVPETPTILESNWNLFGPYWMGGVFDPIDMVATLVGGLIAMELTTRLPMGESNAVS